MNLVSGNGAARRVKVGPRRPLGGRRIRLYLLFTFLFVAGTSFGSELRFPPEPVSKSGRIAVSALSSHPRLEEKGNRPADSLAIAQRNRKKKQTTRTQAKPEAPSPPGVLGLVLHTRGGLAFVKRVVPDWPADRGGLVPGDLILAVNDKLAQAPVLNEALDLLSGPAGERVEVTVLRPGESQPRTLSLVRTSRPPPSPAQVPPPISDTEKNEQLVKEAVDTWARGRTDALDQVLSIAGTRPPDQGALMLSKLTNGLLDLGGEEAWRTALHVADVAIDYFPASPLSPDMVRSCFASGSGGGDVMREMADRALLQLEESRQVPANVRESAAQQWNVVRALGWVRDGKQHRGEKELAGALEKTPADLVVMRPNGEVLWKSAVRPASGLKDYIELSLREGDMRSAWKGIRAVLLLDEPAWIYPAVEELSHRSGLGKEAQSLLAPRWLLPRLETGWEELISPEGDSLGLGDLQKGRPALLLSCTPYDQKCESWRVALSDILGQHSDLEVATAIINEDGSAPSANLAWPAFSVGGEVGGRPGTRLLLLDGSGLVVAEYGDYEPGLEYRLVTQLRVLYENPGDAGPYLVRGGIGQNSWTLRWSRWDVPVYDIALGEGRDLPRMWILSPGGKLEVLEEGEDRWSSDGLTRLDRMLIAELDGDRGEELLVYRDGDGLLEALDGGRTPLWIVPEDAPIELVARHDIDQDGKDEVFVARRGDVWLKCYNSDGSLRWKTRIVGGVRSITFGGVVWVGPLIAVTSRGGDLMLMTPQGEMIETVETELAAGELAFADLDGDYCDELIVGGGAIQGLVAEDLNGDGRPEVAVRAGTRQVLVFRPDSRLATRLTWEVEDLVLRGGELDGDQQRELVVKSGDGEVTIVDWLDPESAVQ